MLDFFGTLAELWSIQTTRGFDLWKELVCEIAQRRRSGMTGAVAGECERTVAKRHGMYYLAADSSMRAAIKPLIEADEAALATWGIFPKKRTACALADAVADLYNTGIEMGKIDEPKTSLQIGDC